MAYIVLNQPIFSILKHSSFRIDVFLVNMVITPILEMAEFITAEDNALFL